MNDPETVTYRYINTETGLDNVSNFSKAFYRKWQDMDKQKQWVYLYH